MAEERESRARRFARGGVSESVAPGAPPKRVVDIAFAADRDELYTAWNAVANLADLAGKVSVTMHAEFEAGFDQSMLQNGVLEPLKAAGSH